MVRMWRHQLLPQILSVTLFIGCHIAGANDFTPAVLLPYGIDEGDQLISDANNTVNSATTLTRPFLYSEHRHNELHVSRNGAVSFSAPLSEIAPQDLDMERKDIIAVFYAPTAGGNIYLRSSAQANSLLSREISAKIRRAFTDSNAFESQLTVLITWEDMQNIERNASNTFQLALATNEQESYAVFVYSQIAWPQSDQWFAQAGFFSADGRSEKLLNSGTSKIVDLAKVTNFNEPGLFLYRISNAQPLDPRRDGTVDYDYHNEQAQDYDPDDQGTLEPCPLDPFKDNCPPHCNVITDANECTLCVCPTVLQDNSYSRMSVNEVDLSDINGDVEISPGALPIAPPIARATDLSCAIENSPTQCHVAASCVHASASINDNGRLGCCACASNQIGNGVECLPTNDPQRINGFIDIVVNGRRIDRTELFAYIQTADGQQHTALTRIPVKLAAGFALLDVIGSSMGWLFAKTTNAIDLPNGFQLTGGSFNRTVNLQLGDRYAVIIRQIFLDRQRDGAFSVNTDVSGTLPEFQHGFTADIPDYEETFRRESLGVLRSYNERVVTIADESTKRRPFRIVTDQQIHFVECPHRDNSAADKITIRYERISNQFSTVDDAVRFASRAIVIQPTALDGGNSLLGAIISPPRSNPSANSDDVCASNAHVCDQPHMICRSYPPSYRCECQEGYSVMHDESVKARFRCVDTDECARREHDCDINAVCENTEGSYSCTCKTGYVGDGRVCSRINDPMEAEHGMTTMNSDRLHPCTRHTDCHQWGKCIFDVVPVNGGYVGVCKCRDYYVGDGFAHCGPSEERLSSKTHDNNHLEPSVIIANDDACEIRLGCHAKAHCVVNGAHKFCQCIDGYYGNGQDCMANISNDELLPMIPSPSPQPMDIAPHTNSNVTKKQCMNHLHCHPNATCGHVEGDDICQCLPGYTGDGFNECTLSEECSPSIPQSCTPHATCQFSITDQRYTCQCMQGFTKEGAYCVAQSPAQAAVAAANAAATAPKPYVPTCLQDKSICSQHAECVPDENANYVCNCKYGYRGNGRTCQSVNELTDGTLLIGRGMSVIQRSTKLDVPGKQLVVVPRQVVVDLAYDCVDQRIYWSDISGHTIRSVALNGTGLTSSYTSELSSPEGIAIDWSSRNLYYVDSIKNELGVLSLNGRYKKTLVSEGLVNPRAVVIDVNKRQLYYSDWQRNNAHISRIDLDGTNNQVFLTEDVHLPNGLTLLNRRNEVCWVDAGNQRLSCIGKNGNGRRIVYQRMEYPFGLTCYREERFYWTDWKDHMIHTVTINGDGYATFLPGTGGRGKIYGLINIPQQCYGEKTACADENGGCAQLCLPSLTVPEQRVCKCADNVKLGTDSSTAICL